MSPARRPPRGAAELRLLDRIDVVLSRFRIQVGRTIVGQERVCEQLLVTLLAGGHAILEGVPGLAKTLLVQSVASALSLRFGRIQFTPDLMPADVTGTIVVQEDPRDGERRFAFRPGPVFVNLLLADEINRTPPKTQAALLEGMGEGTVTAGGGRHRLPAPFSVLATQNPIEQEGTYPLPEAQLDRFLMKIVVDYPAEDEEREILRRTTGEARSGPAPVISRDELLALQRIVLSIPLSDHVRRYATRLVRATRGAESGGPEWASSLIAWGVGPRAARALLLCAKALAVSRGRFSVTRADVRDVAFPVLRHRIVPSFRAEGEGLGSDDLVSRLLVDTPVFPTHDGHDAVTRTILRL